jgi:hypothetical protein
VIVRATPLAFALAILLAWVLFLGVVSDRVELFVAAIPWYSPGSDAAASTAAPRIEPRGFTSSTCRGRANATVTVVTAEPAPMVEGYTVAAAARGRRRKQPAVLSVKPGRETVGVLCSSLAAGV